MGERVGVKTNKPTYNQPTYNQPNTKREVTIRDLKWPLFMLVL